MFMYLIVLNSWGEYFEVGYFEVGYFERRNIMRGERGYFERGDMHSIAIGIIGWRFFRGDRVNTPLRQIIQICLHANRAKI